MQLSLFSNLDDVESLIKQILARRRAYNCSGQNGEDIDQIRAALKAAKGGSA